MPHTKEFLEILTREANMTDQEKIIRLKSQFLEQPEVQELLQQTREDVERGFIKPPKASCTPKGYVKIFCRFKHSQSIIDIYSKNSLEATYDDYVFKFLFIYAKSEAHSKVWKYVEENKYKYPAFREDPKIPVSDPDRHFTDLLIEEISKIPNVRARVIEVISHFSNLIKSGNIQKKVLKHKKNLHSDKLKKAIAEALRSGLEKEDILELLDGEIVKAVLES